MATFLFCSLDARAIIDGRDVRKIKDSKIGQMLNMADMLTTLTYC